MNGTITLPRSVVERALEALDEIAWSNNTRRQSDRADDARIVLRAALEQPQVNSPEIQEGWRLVPVEPADSQIRAAQDTWWYACNCETYWDQIYAAMIAAAPQPPVVEQPQVEQEPVAYYVMNGAALFQLFRSKSQADALAYDLQTRHDVSGSPAHFHVVPLYTHPQPKREPLTDAQINGHRLALPYDGEDLPDPWDFKQGVRAAERAHRIGGEA